MPSSLVPIRRALLSVSDKTGLVEFARFLAEHGVELVSTGGSAKALRDAGLAVKEVADLTGFPEIMDGRVKTLHPKVHGGLLGRRDKADHRVAMDKHGIVAIDLVVVTLYPFEATVAANASVEECIENIDIGGPAMIRSAAKNHAFVTVVVDPADYVAVADDLRANDGSTGGELRRRLAAKAYARTGSYDAAISQWFAKLLGESFPERLVVAGERRQVLRYGENPHQQAAFYIGGDKRPGIATARQIQGKELSFNNLNDTDAAYELVAELAAERRPAVAIIKHANPCGAALGSSIVDAYRKALACDPVSAFGGIVALSRPIDAATAEEVTKIFTEVVIAPGADDAARAIFAKKKNLRLLLAGELPDPTATGMTLRSVAGGYLFQSRDAGHIDRVQLKVVTKRQPSPQEYDDLLFAFAVAKHVKSNAIVYVKNLATVGIGAGQMSRIDSARIAARKAEDSAAAAGSGVPLTKGSVVASDAYFPFSDGLLAAAEAGVTAVIQPGGSMRDDEVIAAADQAGLAMVFTGMRHFRH
ncbi:MAG: bifunctional phosphoribosylaminoimidazolecarboxamide formyltransferase/IMP cyclohydrolase [Alphaproteobacteria bacterium]|nr:bifunctional phosphoribosylaminoimidazolecarboxamide formyltransferase/IMP cyclohydrolase [Alphaproteobacteria bacterium]